MVEQYLNDAQINDRLACLDRIVQNVEFYSAAQSDVEFSRNYLYNGRNHNDNDAWYLRRDEERTYVKMAAKSPTKKVTFQLEQGTSPPSESIVMNCYSRDASLLMRRYLNKIYTDLVSSSSSASASASSSATNSRRVLYQDPTANSPLELRNGHEHRLNQIYETIKRNNQLTDDSLTDKKLKILNQKQEQESRVDSESRPVRKIPSKPKVSSVRNNDYDDDYEPDRDTLIREFEKVPKNNSKKDPLDELLSSSDDENESEKRANERIYQFKSIKRNSEPLVSRINDIQANSNANSNSNSRIKQKNLSNSEPKLLSMKFLANDFIENVNERMQPSKNDWSRINSVKPAPDGKLKMLRRFSDKFIDRANKIQKRR